MKSPFLLHILGFLAIPWFGFATVSFNAEDASAFVSFSQESQRLGRSFSSGDLNGDGYDDLVMAASMTDSDGFTDNGALSIWFGTPGELLENKIMSEANVVLAGQANFELLGDGDHHMAIRDFNGDEYDDLVVSTGSKAYILYGRANFDASISVATLPHIVVPGGSFIRGDVRFGDLNNDGFDDLILGLTNYKMYLIYGASTHGTSTLYTSHTLNSVYNARISGESGGEFAGDWMDSRDFDGDGYDDIVVADRYNDSNGSNTGSIYIFYGKSAMFSSGLSSAIGIEVRGSATGSQFGYFAAAGDITGDRKAEIFVRDPNNDTSVSLFQGSSARFTAGVYTTFVDSTITNVVNQSAYFTARLNEDAVVDLVIGRSAGTLETPHVSIIYGELDTLPSGNIDSFQDILITGNIGTQFGQTLQSSDLNNDGYRELYIGSYLYDDPDGAGDEGKVYQWYFAVDNDQDGVFGDRGIITGTDCNDNDGSVSAEITYYKDSDADGLGNPNTFISYCSSTAPSGYADNSLDVNDSDTDNDGVSNVTDCDNNNADIFYLYYQDADGDGLGNAAVTVCSGASASVGYVNNADDISDAVLVIQVVTDPAPVVLVPADPALADPATGANAADVALADPVSTDVSDSVIAPATAEVSISVVSVEGDAKGKIVVEYSDGSSKKYTIFESASDTSSKAVLWEDGTRILVLSAKGTKLAWVDAMTGEVLDRLKLGEKKYKKNTLKLHDFYEDGKIEALVVSKKEEKVRVALVKVKINQDELKEYDGIKLNKKKVLPKKTKFSEKKIKLRKENGSVLETIKVKSDYTFQ